MLSTCAGRMLSWKLWASGKMAMRMGWKERGRGLVRIVTVKFELWRLWGIWQTKNAISHLEKSRFLQV